MIPPVCHTVYEPTEGVFFSACWRDSGDLVAWNDDVDQHAVGPERLLHRIERLVGLRVEARAADDAWVIACGDDVLRGWHWDGQEWGDGVFIGHAAGLERCELLECGEIAIEAGGHSYRISQQNSVAELVAPVPQSLQVFKRRRRLV